jgi:hypothetical protein
MVKNGLMWKEPMMATKKPSKPEVRYSEIEFSLDEYPNCCGIEVAYGFEDTGGESYNSFQSSCWREPTKQEWRDSFPYTSRKAQLDAFYKDLLRRRSKCHIQITLVSKYKGEAANKKNKGQFPDLLEYLTNVKKWKVYETFLHPGHGNQLTVLGTILPKKRQPKPTTGFGVYGW